MAKGHRLFQCTQCGYGSSSYLGRCPDCQAWASFEEQHPITASPKSTRKDAASSVIPLNQVQAESYQRVSTGYPEMDRVLGGGLLPGSYILLGGDPGIGKSTLMLQVASHMAGLGEPVLYVSGEESAYQLKSRAERLGVNQAAILVSTDNTMASISTAIETHRPVLTVIDSIQSIYNDELPNTPGSLAQIKDCAANLMHLAKKLNTAILLIGHVTKEGSVSGPKVLEHTVDAVLYFEGEQFNTLRVLRSVKNRFGNTQEIGVFEMAEAGLVEVNNPSELFLSESSYRHMPGSAILATMEGTRPLLVEIQALVGTSAYATPRRVGNGVDYNRLNQIVAVLERRIGLDFSKQDVYVNVVGGLRIDEPAADLAMAMAMVTAHRNISVKPFTVFAGEIGLTGEIRPVSHGETRCREAAKMGFHHMVIPASVKSPDAESSDPLTIQRLSVSTVMDALAVGLGGAVSADSPADEPARLSR